MTEQNSLTHLQNLLKVKKGQIHFVGICGIGMAGLAYFLKGIGFTVSGCDSSCGELADWLRANGITVLNGHSPDHISSDLDLIIKTTAVSDDLSELVTARTLSIPVLQRGIVLAALTDIYDAVCVCGTHGKSTTSVMLAQVLRSADMSPNYLVGAECERLPGVAATGSSSILVSEADESDGTLAEYFPEILIVTNIDFDHAETFKNLEELKACFKKVVEQTKQKIFYCADDPGAFDVCSRFTNAHGYGFDNGATRIHILEQSGQSTEFEVVTGNTPGVKIKLPVPGRHNALNATAAMLAAESLGLDRKDFAKSVSRFVLPKRRFEHIVKTPDFQLISDYAHHPSEISTAVISARQLNASKIIAIFQPHRFTRTRALADRFATAFEGVDRLILLPVFRASESPVRGGTELDLFEQFRKHAHHETFLSPSPRAAWEFYKRTRQAGDLVLIVGAGDINSISGIAGAELGVGSFLPEHPAIYIRSGLESAGLNNSEVRYKESLSNKTSFRTGGLADVFINVGSLEDLQKTFIFAKNTNLPIWVFGAGRNMLVTDMGLPGICIRLTKEGFGKILVESDELRVGAAVTLADLVNFTIQHGISGFDFLIGIPGTIGGAIRMNAGAFGNEIGSFINWVDVVDR
ncbi:MAG: UDP-N-acetylmuramate--L-alanine ligase, partial [Lentisphaerae bacterium]|nr:UDP-N-acetylmuramate--L-alanine ligase [Lentisphaerota bacterium]